jgi:hypothetical protein
MVGTFRWQLCDQTTLFFRSLKRMLLDYAHNSAAPIAFGSVGSLA